MVASHGAIFLFWVPLAAQWLMMAAEGPFLAAVIARMGEPVFNLAAFGVAFAFAILVESPVIMLMSASTALAEDAESYRRLRTFALGLNALATGLLLLVLVPRVYTGLTGGLLGLPEPVTALLYGALWLLLPWPAAIGYRRFLHGVLIRSGRTRLVAYGTVIRLGAMAATAFALYRHGGLPGAWVGAAALSVGVTAEAAAARLMAGGAVRTLLGDGTAHRVPGPTGVPGDGVEAGAGAEIVTTLEALPERPLEQRADDETTPVRSYGEITRFYVPLALTSLIGLSVHPMLTFFMGRAAAPVESLAVFPVVHALSFLFRAPGFSFQEVVVALIGRRLEHARKLAAFGAGLALAASGGLALVAYTPLAAVWFETVSGLPPELSALAVTPTRILVLLPAVAVLLAFQHGLLVQARTTRSITIATALELVTIGSLFALIGWHLGLLGVTAAVLSLVGGRLLGAGYLGWPVRRALQKARSRNALSAGAARW